MFVVCLGEITGPSVVPGCFMYVERVGTPHFYKRVQKRLPNTPTTAVHASQSISPNTSDLL